MATKSKVSALLTETIDPVLQQNMFVPPLLRDFPAALPLMTAINKAHILMLVRQKIITPEVGRALAKGVLQIEAEGASAFTLDPGREDTYFNYEARLIQLTGADIGGRAHIARSRNDLKATQDRLRGRALLLRILDGALILRQTVVRQATQYRDVVMPGYTHLQPAQPITFGYYLLGIAHALERDYRRLAEAYPRVNLNALGTGALAGTSFPIDRRMTASLLGFDGIVGHAQDTVASRDYLVEILGNTALMATTWGRLAQDFYIMTSYEFATVFLPDRVAATSSIMPQKKNITVLETLKARVAHLMGAHTTALAGMKGTTFTLTVDATREAFRWCWDALEETVQGLAICELVVASAEPRRERMAELVRANYSTATDLADALVRDAGLSFRDAHHVVGAVVRAAIDRGLPADRIDAGLVREQAKALLGRWIDLPDTVVAAAVDPIACTEARRATGGPSEADMSDMTADLEKVLAADQAELTQRRKRVDAAAATLNAQFHALAG